jgi:uncharacterized phage protein (TIGR02220 family)
MKFIICTNCNDIIVPQPSRRKCLCKLTFGYTVAGVTHYGGNFAIPMNFKDEWFSKDSKGRDPEAVQASAIKEESSGPDRDLSIKVIEYLNQVAGTAFSVKFPSSASDLILARKTEHTCAFDDFKRIIDNKWAQWAGTEREKFMRPDTLFGKKKFLSYFGEKTTSGQQQADSKDSATSRSVKNLLS